MARGEVGSAGDVVVLFVLSGGVVFDPVRGVSDLRDHGGVEDGGTNAGGHGGLQFHPHGSGFEIFDQLPGVDDGVAVRGGLEDEICGPHLPGLRDIRAPEFAIDIHDNDRAGVFGSGVGAEGEEVELVSVGLYFLRVHCAVGAVAREFVYVRNRNGRGHFIQFD